MKLYSVPVHFDATGKVEHFEVHAISIVYAFAEACLAARAKYGPDVVFSIQGYNIREVAVPDVSTLASA
jgi:hypothetical protein